MSEQPDVDQGEVDTLDVAVAELRPALEAILMVSDEPLGTIRLASVVGHPVEEVEDPIHLRVGLDRIRLPVRLGVPFGVVAEDPEVDLHRCSVCPWFRFERGDRHR